MILLSALSGLFLAIHFVLWFESLEHTSVASSTAIVCTEVVWVCLGFCLFLKGKLSLPAVIAITVTLLATCAIQGVSLFGYRWSPVIVGALLAVFSTILGHSIFSWCLKYLSPSFVSASKLCEPVVAAIFAIFLFNEIPVLLQIIGGILILGGVLYYSRIESREENTDKE